VVLVEGILFVLLVKAEDGWLWHSDRMGNKTQLKLGYFGRFVVEIERGKMENFGCEAVANALHDSHLWMKIVAEADWILAPSFS
jgi:hypothetical protein